MCDCAVDLIDLNAKLRLMEQHYHEDMNELFAELSRLKKIVDDIQEERDDGETLPEFLGYLDQQMERHPELIVEADESQLQRIAELVRVVELEAA